MQLECDVLVIGGGMAGVSVAYELAARVRVVLVEAEPTLAYHTTGRSAALYAPSYGNATIRALTAASLEGYHRIERDLAEAPLLTRRDVLWIAAPDDVDELVRAVEVLAAEGGPEPIPPRDAVDRFPALRPEMVGAAALEAGTADIDVAGLHQAFVRGFRSRGGVIVRHEPVARVEPGWLVHTSRRRISATRVVDAAGAWADDVARMAGVDPVGLVPLLRSLFTSPVARGTPSPEWPFLAEVTARFYCRPEGRGVLASPADETPSEPGDVAADPLEVARAIEVINRYTTLGLRSVSSSWAGLRTFAPDRSPVVGERPGDDGFFWMAGQGGYGIQIAPALAQLARALLLDEPIPFATVAASDVSPGRFASR